MNKALESIRNWWVEAQLKAPPWVQRTLISRLHEAKEVARLLSSPYLPVCQLEGRGQGGPLTVTHIGLKFAKPYWVDILFAEPPTERQAGHVPFWRCHELASLSSSDLVIVEGAKHLIRSLPRQKAIVLPESVLHILDIRGGWDDVRSRFHHSALRGEVRLARKYDYQYEISHDDGDFRTFYNDMYLPTMKSRHGPLAFPMPIYEAYQYFRQGLLFFATRGGRRVSGGIWHSNQDVACGMILGVLNADETLLKEGASGAQYILFIRWAIQQGYKVINFLESVPYLKSGIFQFKRKWGGIICASSHLHRQVWVKVNHVTPAVSQFLKENPFVMVDESGKLHGLIAVDDTHTIAPETRQEWETHYVTPGLSSLVIRSVGNFAAGSEDSSNSDVVIPLPCSASRFMDYDF
jgi:hypothetical protein